MLGDQKKKMFFCKELKLIDFMWKHEKFTWLKSFPHDTKEEMQHNKYSFKGNLNEWLLTSDPCIHLPFSGVVLEHLQGYGGSLIIIEKDHYQAVHVAYNWTTP